MSAQPTDPNPDIQRLVEEGYELEIVQAHLVVHSIPYVNSAGELSKGALVAPYTGTGKQGVSAAPKDHTMHFQGDEPHHALSKKPMAWVINGAKNHQPFSGFMTQYYLSNKANGVVPKNYYDLVSHYHSLFRAEAQQIDPNADGRTGKARPNRHESSPFCFPDTASSRAGITAIAQKFEGMKIAIIGLGGTGSYILDLVAKTPVLEIHLFDGDFFDSHNAFRAPGAASIDEINLRAQKTDYFADKYNAFRNGIVSNPVRIDESNLDAIKGFDFVFIAIDSGKSRALISQYLVSVNVAFIDVGMGMNLAGNERNTDSLSGICRVTLSTAAKSDHLSSHLDVSDNADDLYQSNIQIADLNSLNAALAVLKWKQHVGAYNDQSGAYNLTFSISLGSLTRTEEDVCE